MLKMVNVLKYKIKLSDKNREGRDKNDTIHNPKVREHIIHQLMVLDHA